LISWEFPCNILTCLLFKLFEFLNKYQIYSIIREINEQEEREKELEEKREKRNELKRKRQSIYFMHWNFQTSYYDNRFEMKMQKLQAIAERKEKRRIEREERREKKRLEKEARAKIRQEKLELVLFASFSIFRFLISLFCEFSHDRGKLRCKKRSRRE
jgi:hypothetical protein